MYRSRGGIIMRVKLDIRYQQITNFLWERGIYGATIADICQHTGLKNSSHIMNIINKLI